MTLDQKEDPVLILHLTSKAAWAWAEQMVKSKTFYTRGGRHYLVISASQTRRGVDVTLVRDMFFVEVFSAIAAAANPR